MHYLNRGVVPEELIPTNMTTAFSIKTSLSVRIAQLPPEWGHAALLTDALLVR